MEKGMDRHSDMVALFRKLRRISLVALRYRGPHCGRCVWMKGAGKGKGTCPWQRCQNGDKKPRRSGAGAGCVSS